MTCSGRWLRTCVAFAGFFKFLPLGAKVRVGVENKLLVINVVLCDDVRNGETSHKYDCSKGGCCVE